MITGMRDFSTTARISPSPPRGMMRSISASFCRSITTADLSVVGTNCKAKAGSPASESAREKSAASAQFE